MSSETWHYCEEGAHRLCPARVFSQHPNATAGLPIPEGEPAARWIACACGCHGGRS